MSGTFAAAAMVSGAFYAPTGGCSPTRPVPILDFHGTADQVIPYDGSPSRGLPAIGRWAADWAVRDGCTAGPTEFYDRSGVHGDQWTSCRSGAVVTNYRITGGGHTWPGQAAAGGSGGASGGVADDLDATSLIMAFFTAHPLPSS
jgi:polyhydroxybutyrate depolymerase